MKWLVAAVGALLVVGFLSGPSIHHRCPDSGTARLDLAVSADLAARRCALMSLKNGEERETGTAHRPPYRAAAYGDAMVLRCGNERAVVVDKPLLRRSYLGGCYTAPELTCFTFRLP
jgi:hypothetical protein